MTERKIADRYAKTLFQLSKAENELPQVFEDVKFTIACIKNCRDFLNLLHNPTIHKEKKNRCIQAIFSHYQYPKSKTFLKIIALMLKKHRESLSYLVCQIFIDYFLKNNQSAKAKLITASPPSEKVLEEIKDFLNKKTQAKQHIIESVVDETLIGGFILEFDEQVLDISIKNRLRVIKKHLKAS